jgi:hypothetical protein
MATRKDTRSFSSGTTSDFPAMGTDGPQVVDVSGAPSPNTELVSRHDSASVTPPDLPPGHRAPIEIDATSGERLGEETEQSVATARHLSVRETAARAGTTPRQQEYFDHLFGLNLPGHTRA